jgi:hypothetical protein
MPVCAEWICCDFETDAPAPLAAIVIRGMTGQSSAHNGRHRSLAAAQQQMEQESR